MRGQDRTSGSLFSYIDLDARVPAGHPLRAMRELVNASLEALDGAFAALYEAGGRPSIAPERLLRASLLQFLYSIRSERQLVERLEFDLLFRWFVGLGIDDPVFDASTFSKNRDRLLTSEIAQGFLCALLAQPRVKRLLSSTLPIFARLFQTAAQKIDASAMTRTACPTGNAVRPKGPNGAHRSFHSDQ